MKKYTKIDSLFKRDQNKKLIIGDYTCLEFQYLRYCQWVATEKVDGTNIRVGAIFNHTNLNKEGYNLEFDIRGRTDNAQTPPHLMEKLKSIFRGKDKLWYEKFKENSNKVVIYGEGYGPKINGGGKYSSKPDFVVFDVRIGDWWMRRTDVEDICSDLGLRVVPLLGEKTLKKWVEYVAQGFKSKWGDFEAEGVVVQPAIPLSKRNGDRIITKICSRDY